ncbi:MAG: glutamine--fructose-6-phosphate transaminase (isomerizing) [Planctomycetes bacterium]|nr:glutamine--fructose-6-phosphate transaminase (isomerizing) [Planctomycetota bacterium]
MCGIIGYIGRPPALPVLVGGLQRLEYRGYDSAGVATLGPGGVFHRKCAGAIASLAEHLNGRIEADRSGSGIGHTRWATHGEPTAVNAHPHFSCDGKVAIVHNGIVENHATLRDALTARGHTFASETDTEVLAHLLEEAYSGGDPLRAVGRALREVHGSYALAILFSDHPDFLVAARRFSPLVVGLHPEGNLVASDIPALLPITRDIRLVDDGQMVALRRERVDAYTFDLEPCRLKTQRVAGGWADTQQQGFPHFMLKEIHEQPDVVRRELMGRWNGDSEELRMAERALRNARRAVIVGCGTAWHAGLYAKYLLESLLGLPADCCLSSELRYAPPPLDERTLVLAISQSGETADTLQALRLARERGAATLAITNTPASSLAREAQGAWINRAGVEVGVAATKTYVAQLSALALMIRRVANRNDLIEPLTRIPDQIQEILRQDEAIRKIAERFLDGYDFMYIARRFNVPTAFEGALKLKEISYLHAEGYAAGEMKHGPLALVDEGLAAVAVAPRDDVYDKILSNVEEIRCRKGAIIAVVTRGDRKLVRRADASIEVEATEDVLSPLLTIIPLQLLAYHMATILGRNVDKPRNLAKSVTVE